MIDTVSTQIPNPEEEHRFDFFRSFIAQPWLPFLLAVIFIAADFLSGPYIQFPVLFVLPVALAAWFGGFRNGAALAVGQPFLNLAIAFLTATGIPGMPPILMAANAGIRASVLVLLAYFVSRTSRQRRELERRVGLLRSEIPTCITCGKAEDEQKQWIPLSLYIARHTGAHFSNAICPVCSKQKYGAS
ncbi:MAG: hypothetical protein ACOYNN_14340 [Terrimicrobiaceae bacterium]